MGIRRKSGLAITFFSFQDIIICVTGVLILIVLLLVLEITESASNDSLAEAAREMATELREELRTISAQMETITQDLGDDREVVQDATKNPETHLNTRIAEENQQIEGLQGTLKSLQGMSDQLQRESQQLEQDRDKMDQAEQELAELELRKEQLIDRLKQVESKNAVRYTVPRGVNPERAWICEVTSSGLLLTKMDSAEGSIKIPVSNWDGETETAFNSLKSRLAFLSPTPAYLLFLIRPKGNEFNNLLVERGEEIGIEIGIEYIAADHVILR